MEYTKRRNVNRGYMKLEVWQDAVQLFGLVNEILSKIEKLDFKLKSQLLDAAQSVSSNISEGYCRKTINEYLYFVNVALGSLGETLTRVIGLREIDRLSEDDFERIDEAQYKVENKLLRLAQVLQEKRLTGDWDELIPHPKSHQDTP